MRRLYPLPIFVALASLSLGASGCMFILNPGNPPVPEELDARRVPVMASAGADREILRGYTARLEGLGTYSPVGRPFSVRWRQIEVTGDSVSLNNDFSPTPQFLAPLEEQVLAFELTADDGLWVTRDVVRLHVKRTPRLGAPRVSAGPDRYLNEGEAGPVAEDVNDAPADGEIIWETVTAEPSPTITSDETALTVAPSISRLSASRGGLRSAPDYIMFLSAQNAPRGQTAPVASLNTESLVTPGASFTLDASGSTDSNGDALTYRWEQVQGRPMFEVSPSDSAVDLSAPNQPQELVFRVFASDGILESGPARVSVNITAAVEVPVVAPQYDSRTHPGNLIELDADGIPTPDELIEVSFAWTQTVGETEVTLDTSNDPNGRYAAFEAPDSVGDLAFAVVATVPGELAETEVESSPAVARVTVVDFADNTAPEIFLCTEFVSEISKWVVTAVVADPEVDVLNGVNWSYSLTNGASTILAEQPSDAFVETPLCDLDRDAQAARVQTSSNAFQATLTPPSVESVLTVTLDACDSLQACSDGSVDIEIAAP